MAAAPHEPITFGRYQLLSRIAMGGMAEIFLAKQLGPGRFERKLVIKRILPHLANDPKFVEMFLDEAALAAQLAHPCIAQVYDFGQEAGSYFIALELVRGPDLRTVLAACEKTQTRMPAHIAVRIASQALAALDYAHHAVDEKGQPLKIVHRDVSPQNILLSFDGMVKLVDFGIAKAANATHETEAGVVKGKYSYMAPEQLERVPLDGRCDQYAATLVLYEMLSLQRAIPGIGTQALAAAMRAEIPPIESVAEVPAHLAKVVRRALQRDREKRYPDCRAMIAELDAQLLEWNTTAPPEEIAAFLGSLQSSLGEPLSAIETGSTRPAVRTAAPEPSPEQLSSMETRIGAIDPAAAQSTAVGPAAASTGTRLMNLGGRRPWWLFSFLGVLALGAVGWLLTQSTPPPPPPAETLAGRRLDAPPAHVDAEPPKVAVAEAVRETKPGEVTPPPPPAKAAPEPAQPAAPVVAAAPIEAEERGPRHAKPEPASVHPTLAAHREVTHSSPERSMETHVAQAAAVGALTVASTPWMDVYVDGKKLGATPVIKASVPVGHHQLRLVNGELGVHKELEVTVAADEPSKVSFSLEKGTVKLFVKPWADVTIDGQSIGSTPVPAQQLFEGSHTIELANKELGKHQRRTVVVKPGQTEELKVDLTQP